MKQRVVAGSAESVAEQIKTKVLDAGVDGVIVYVPTQVSVPTGSRHCSW